jgi:hypothetical protein
VYSEYAADDGQRNCAKHVEFHAGVILEIGASGWFYYKEMRHKVHAAVTFRVQVMQSCKTRKFGANDCLYQQHAGSQFLKMLVQQHCQHYTTNILWVTGHVSTECSQ